jgi:hypothetical protein
MAFKQPLKQTRHDVLSTDPNIQSDSERNTTRSGMMESFGKALGVAASFFPLGRVVKGAKAVKGVTGYPKGSYMDKFHSTTGLNKAFFDRVKRNNPGATSRTSGNFPFIQGTGRK